MVKGGMLAEADFMGISWGFHGDVSIGIDPYPYDFMGSDETAKWLSWFIFTHISRLSLWIISNHSGKG